MQKGLNILLLGNDLPLKNKLVECLENENILWSLISSDLLSKNLLISNNWKIIILTTEFGQDLHEILSWINQSATQSPLLLIASQNQLTHILQNQEVNPNLYIRQAENESEILNELRASIQWFILTSENGLRNLVEHKISLRDFIRKNKFLVFNLLESIYQLSPVGIVITDKESRQIQMANAHACHILGYSKEELTSLTTGQITHPDDYHDDIDFVQGEYIYSDKNTESSSKPQIKRYLRKNGETLWAKVTRRDFYILPGFPLRLGILEDITHAVQAEQKIRQSQEELKRSEAQLRNLIDALPVPILVNKLDGEFLYFNEQFRHKFELDLPNPKIEDLFVKNFFCNESDLMRLREHTTHGETVFMDQTPLWTRQKNKLTFRIISTPIEFDQNPAYLGILIDTSDWIKAEESLRRSEFMNRLITENIRELVMIHDETGKNLYVSPSVFEVTGHSVEEMTGRNSFEFFHPDEQTHLAGVLTSLVTSVNHQVEPVAYRFLCKNGEYKWMESSPMGGHSISV